MFNLVITNVFIVLIKIRIRMSYDVISNCCCYNIYRSNIIRLNSGIEFMFINNRNNQYIFYNIVGSYYN